jgi:chaperonin cofactor prefoldin
MVTTNLRQRMDNLHVRLHFNLSKETTNLRQRMDNLHVRLNFNL